MPNNNYLKIMVLTISISLTPIAYSDPVIINNNNYSQSPAPYASQPSAPQPGYGCNNNSYGTSGGLPPGSYVIKNPDGTSNRIYTTGDKQPYIVDNNCNPSPVIQPYIYTQPPTSNQAARPTRPSPRPMR